MTIHINVGNVGDVINGYITEIMNWVLSPVLPVESSAHCIAPFPLDFTASLAGTYPTVSGSGRCLRRLKINPYSKADFREVAYWTFNEIEFSIGAINSSNAFF
jgi:hypothetical protein